MEKYDKFDLISSAFKRKPTERIPYSIWKHFPEYDKTPEGLCKAHLKFQKHFDSDIMKICIQSQAFVTDYGAELGGYDPYMGSRINLSRIIKTIEDWDSISINDPHSGEMGEQIKGLRLISKEIKHQVPTIMTVFSPFMVMSYMDPNILEHYHKYPDLILSKLQMITQMLSEFTQCSIEAGANGIFLATQDFNENLKPQTRIELEFNPISALISKSIKPSNFVILHLHGDTPDFDLASQIPNISGINWHSQQTPPTITEASSKFTGALLGGLDFVSWEKNPNLSISKDIEEVFRNIRTEGVIFSPGCVIPQPIQDEKIYTVIKTLKNLPPSIE
jgi:uroporphyrinogen decarboxylase